MTNKGRWLRSTAILGCASLLWACGGSETPSDNTAGEASEAAPAQSAGSSETGHTRYSVGEALSGANVLVFSRTAGWRHGSIEAGQQMFDELADEYGFTVTKTEDPTVFSDAQIADFDTVVFLNTTGDVLNDRQQRAFERYIQSGGGYVGIHAASDTEHDGAWPWYIRLVGGTFAGHPMNPSNVQQARLSRAEGAGPLGNSLPENFTYVDEWYDFNHLDTTTRPILYIDRDSYVGAIAEGQERIAWFHDYDGGRVFYTNLGHEDATYADQLFRDHVVDGMVYAVGDKTRRPLLDGRPDPDRFVKDVLVTPLNEPVSLDVMPDGSILVVERPGTIKRWREGEEMEVIGEVTEVHYPEGNSEFGLLAIAGVPHDGGPLEGAYVMYNTLVDEEIMQRLSYVPFADEAFDFSDERALFDVPTDPNCCHTGGAVRFGPDGYLYIAMGDNSNPHGIDGLAPLSDGEDDQEHDARRSAGNTDDLRGKIVRIIPSTDGSYEIPEGNLFADAEEGRPEIYVMGTRNPYTIGFDEDTGELFYGDVGPDGREDTPQGPRGYDEINRVAEAGNFGWPFFIGDNYPYAMTPPTEDRPARWQNPLAPVNESARNTGARELPPANPALIWYPYAGSERFPEMGAGGRNALVAGVYHAPAGGGDGAWPTFFEGKLVISEFMRRYLKSVDINEAGQVEKITSVAEGIELAGPLDLEFGPDGALYVLEYGTRWFSGNEDAGLSRVRYTGNDNRPPKLNVSLDRNAGSLPLSISARTANAFDPDGDDFTVEWAVVEVPEGTAPTDYKSLFDTAVADGEEATLTIESPGRHMVIARATDAKGEAAYSATPVDAGNEQPEVTINLEGNRTFFWPGRDAINYTVSVSDAEDGSTEDGTIAADAIMVRAMAEVTTAPSVAAPMGHLEAAAASGAGTGDEAAQALLAENACTSCHQIEESSIGPAYRDVAARYAGEDDAHELIAASISGGSSGKWGEAAMPPFDFLEEDDVATLSDYILGLHEGGTTLPASGAVTGSDFIEDEEQYVLLTASYADTGSDGAPSLTGSDQVHLRSNTVKLYNLVEDGGDETGISAASYGDIDMLVVSGTGAMLDMGTYDLTGIQSVDFRWSHSSDYWPTGNMRVELHEGAADGKVLGAATLTTVVASGPQTGQLSVNLDEPVNGMTRLFMTVSPLEGTDDDAQFALTHATFQPL